MTYGSEYVVRVAENELCVSRRWNFQLQATDVNVTAQSPEVRLLYAVYAIQLWYLHKETHYSSTRIDAYHGIWMCTLARITTTSLDASDVIPQPPPSTALSRHVRGCRPAVQVDVIPHHNPRQAPRSAVMSAAVTLQCRQMSHHNPRQAPCSAVMSAAVTLQCRQMSHHNPRQALRSAVMSAAVALQCSQFLGCAGKTTPNVWELYHVSVSLQSRMTGLITTQPQIRKQMISTRNFIIRNLYKYCC